MPPKTSAEKREERRKYQREYQRQRKAKMTPAEREKEKEKQVPSFIELLKTELNIEAYIVFLRKREYDYLINYRKYKCLNLKVELLIP